MSGETVRLSDLCELIAEPVQPGARPDALYLGLEHLAPGRLVRIGSGKASEMRSNTSAFQPSDVLYGKLRPYLDKAVLTDEPGVCTTELLVLRAKANVDPRFLAAAVHSPGFLEYAVAGTTGVQHPRTSWAHTRDFPMLAFTLSEQQGIADLLWLVHEAISQSEALVEEAQALKRAAMHTLFTRGLRGEAQKETEIGPLPESWKTWECNDVAQRITVGVVVKPASHYVEEGVPAFRSLNVREDHLDTTDLVYFSNEENDGGLSKSKLASGDVLVVRTGYPGTSCVVPEEFEGSNCIDIVIISTNRQYALPEFLSRFLNSNSGKAQARAAKHGLAQQHLNVGAIKKLKVPLPPTFDEQREVVRVLEAIDLKIDLHRRKRAVLEELFKALLHKLMTGEIRVGELDLAALSDGIASGMIRPQRIGEQG